MNLQELNVLADQIDQDGLTDPESKSTDSLGKVGEIYQKVRPFLEAVGLLFFIPKKWRSAILTFMAVMDSLTAPQTEEV